MSEIARYRRFRGADPRAIGALCVGLLVLTACSGGDDDARDTIAPVGSADSSGVVSAVPTAPSETRAAPAPSTVVTATTAATTTTTMTTMTTMTTNTTIPTTTTTTTATSTTTTATATTEPLAVRELVLRTDGLGSARFGADPDGVISYVTSILGDSAGDTGWVDPFTFAACPGTVARRVDWGVLSLLFTDLSEFAVERPHFIGYEYGRTGEIGDSPAGLRTPGGLTLGSRVVDLLAEYPGAAINASQPAIEVPDNFYVSDVFYGLLTGTAQDDVVTVIFGGNGCGE